ncbi:hypothetical protein OH77DRAFT_735449 [Trametes cingulata]|nr:hypothetical protein OH77DRAFT_735449 [Trametes cingulata]
MAYTLNVTIDPLMQQFLQEGKYKLCIAKKVNGAYTVVWQGSNVLYSKDFSWSSKYQVFGTNPFQSGALVRASTQTQDIAFGQVAIIDPYGTMQPASGTADNSGKFTIRNDFGVINVGVNTYVNGQYAPSYVSANPVVSGRTTLQPIETIMVWFDTRLSTSTMIFQAASDAIEVDFTSVPNHTLYYKAVENGPAGKGVWQLDGHGALLPMTYHLLSNSFEIPAPDDATLKLMTELMNNPRSLRQPPGAVTPPVKLVATAEFQNAGEAQAFLAYVSLTQWRDLGFVKWQPTQLNATVTVTMEFDSNGEDEEDATRLGITRYLDVQYKDSIGKRYKKLDLSVAGQLVTTLPFPNEPPTLTNGTLNDRIGFAVVRYSDTTKAYTFAQQTNGATSDGVQCEAAARGVAVKVSFSIKGDKVDAHERAQRAYDAVIDAFQSMPQGAKPIYVGPIVWDQ